MSMNITTRAAQVLQEIDADIALAKALGNLAWEKSLRCLKTAIEGLLKIRSSYGHFTAAHEIANDQLAALCDQWRAAK